MEKGVSRDPEGFHPPHHRQIPRGALKGPNAPEETRGRDLNLSPSPSVASRGTLEPPKATKFIIFIPVSGLGCSHAPAHSDGARAAFPVSWGFFWGGGNFLSQFRQFAKGGRAGAPGRDLH